MPGAGRYWLWRSGNGIHHYTRRIGAQSDGGGWLGDGGVTGFYRGVGADIGLLRRKFSKKNIKIFALYFISSVLYTRNKG